ncbi:dual specificity protein phosphatase [Tribonema minus]|uniref:protein-tyrosine-phosphatase n=1 Tax=Tribonema minus TaxID=303371 RepID=A0A835YPR9_9STRA|nr:dual specificity protein phosphatase [Tribonema minus]
MHHFFCIDNELVYWNFFLDFGPLSLGQLYRFCQGLNTKLRDASLRDKVIYFYSGVHPHRRANASLLITAWTVLYLHRTPEEALLPFRYIIQSLPAFHDASPCVCTYQLRVIDCLRGLEKARRHRFFDFENFNLLSYEHYEQVEHGDLNWIVEGKFLAFAGPCERSSITPEGYRTLTPDDFIPYFKKHNVTLVIRLNKKYYDETKFTRAGIAHAELYYLDGSVPSHSILSRFLELCERTPGAVAVHCKAGLGRTGTCIGCYLMKHYHMTAAEAIGWMRVCRPGSVIGPQQHFMQVYTASSTARQCACAQYHVSAADNFQFSGHAVKPPLLRKAASAPAMANLAAAVIHPPSHPPQVMVGKYVLGCRPIMAHTTAADLT